MANWFTNIFNSEKRSADTGIRTTFLGIPTATTVTEETAMKIGAVYGCVRVLSESIAKLPFHVYEQSENTKTLAVDHPVYNLIHSEPNQEMTAFAFWQSIMTIALLYGNGYARIIRGAGERPEGLKLYKQGTVTLALVQDQLFATTPDGVIPYYDIFHLRGLGTEIIGLSPIRYAAESLGTTLNAQTFGRKFFENGAHVGGVLEHPGKLSDAAYTNLKNSWESTTTGLDNVGKPKILEEGMKWTKIAMAPEEAQFLQTREFGIADICRVFGVPPHKIADLTHATFSNIEHLNIEFSQDGVLPWAIRIEQEANRKLFRDAEKGKLYTKFNLNALLRADSAARATFYKEMFGIGVFSQNDIRELEEQNPIAGGERYYVQGNNMVPIDRIDDVLTAKTAQKTTNTNGNEGQ